MSVLFNVILGGPSNMTFSARNHQWRIDDKANVCSLIDLFFFFDPEHCRKSWAYWRLRKHTTDSANAAIDILLGIELHYKRGSKVIKEEFPYKKTIFKRASAIFNANQ